MKFGVCVLRAMRMTHIAIYGLSGSTVFSHITSKTGPFSEKKVIEHEMFVLILSTKFV
jgi:hypothetical protein